MAWYDQLFTDIKTALTAVATDIQKKDEFTTVADYNALTALATPKMLTVIRVSYDSTTSTSNAVFLLWPDGTRQRLSVASDSGASDYTQVGTIIDDGGGVYNNLAANKSSSVFDNDTTTCYDASDNRAGVYVGRDLGSAYKLNKITVLPRQNPDIASRVNTAQLQYSTDKSNWTTIATVSGVDSSNYKNLLSYTFSPATARYWRLYWPGANGYGNVAELKLLYAP